MAEYRFDCRKCTNTAHGGPFDADYCLPTIRGEETIVLHDMGGSKREDYLTCGKYTTEPRTVAVYELAKTINEMERKPDDVSAD